MISPYISVYGCINTISHTAQQQESVDSPSSAASSRIQSYMKNKLLSLGQSKTKRNLGNRCDYTGIINF